MRRKQLDFSYQERTANLIEEHYSSWELTYRDEREGFHRFLNRVVCISDELEKEVKYIENMFFPEQMDLSEEWVLYRTEPATSADNVYISGQVISDVLTLADSTDELISYYMDVLIHRNTVSGIVPTVESLTAVNASQTFVLGSGYVWTLDLVNGIATSSGQVDVIDEVEHEVIFDSISRAYRITEEYLPESVEVVDNVGSGIPFSLTSTTDLTGAWNPEFDVNNDGIIDEYEKTIVEQLYGRSMEDLTPEEWVHADWADVNKDGKITEVDYRAVMSSYPSASSDTYGIIKVPITVIGQFIVKYIPDNRQVKSIHTLKDGYVEVLSQTELYKYTDKITYDDNTGIYYGIINETDGKEIRAFTYDSELDNIKGDILLLPNFWNSDCYIEDLDVASGHLFLLVTDNISYKLLYGDIWKEYTEAIDLSCLIELPSEFRPNHIAATEDGYIILCEGDRIEVFKPIRDRYAEIDGVTYTNRKRTYQREDGTDYTTVPHYVFNNFDSFAYSFGIERPWGSDNMTMRKLIMDFYKHQQGHDKIGVNYGIMRELGYENDTIAVSGLAYTLPAELSTSGYVYVNDILMDINDYDGTNWVLSGSIGSILVREGTQIVPDASIVSAYDILSIDGYYFDGNGDVINVIQDVEIHSGTSGMPITVATMADLPYLSSIGIYVSGEPTSGLIETIETAEDESPYIYRNAKPDVSLVDIYRLSEAPLAPTSYEPNVLISGIIDNYNDTEIEL